MGQNNNQMGEDHCVRVKMECVDKYSLMLKLSQKAPGSAQMTSLLFAIDFVKERTGISKMENKEVSLHFDEENITTCEEILNTKMEEFLLKRKGETNPFTDQLDKELSESDEIYLNEKSQLIRIVKKIHEQTGKTKEIHNILAFDINKLPQAGMHKYQGEEVFNMPRAKVPVKDGQSQSKFMLE